MSLRSLVTLAALLFASAFFLRAQVPPLSPQADRTNSSAATPPASTQSADDLPLGVQQKLTDLQTQLAVASRAKNSHDQINTLCQIGHLYEVLSDYPKALDAFHQALDLAGATNGDQQTAVLNGIADILILQGKYDQATDTFQQALNLASKSSDFAGKATALVGLGTTCFKLGAYPKALDAFLQALPIWRQLHDLDREAITLLRLGLVTDHVSGPQKALDYFNQALPIFHQAGDRTNEAADLNDIGNLDSAMGQIPQAIAAFDQALVIDRSLGDAVDAALCLNNIGIAYKRQGESQKALDYYNQALTTFHRAGDRSDEAGILMRIGNVYQQIGDPHKAIDLLTQALAMMREMGEVNDQARALYNIGGVYNGIGEPREAIESYTRAAALYRQVGDPHGEAYSLSGIGLLYGRLGDSQKSLDSWSQALPIYRQMNDPAGTADALTNIGMAWDDLGQFQKALDYYNQALPIYRQVGDRNGEASALNNAGEAWRSLNDRGKALDFFRQSLAITRQTGERDDEAHSLSNIAWVEFSLGDRQQALADYAQALTIAVQVSDPLLQAVVLYHLMTVHAASQPTLAVFFGKQAVNLLQQVRRNIPESDKEMERNFLVSSDSYYRDLAQLLIDQGRLPEAQQVLDLLKTQEYSDYIRGDPPNLTGSVSLTPAELKAQQEYQASTAMLVSASEQWAQLGKVASRTPEQEQHFQQLSDSLAKANQALNDYYARLYKLFGQGTDANKQIADVKGSAAALRDQIARTPHAVALYTIITSDRYSVLVITADAIVAREFPIAQKDLNQKVAALQQALRNPHADPRPLAQDLYQILIGPIQADLDQAHARTLVWSLDGVLRYIPMAALYDGSHYLVEKYSLVSITPASIAYLADKPHMDSVKATAMGISRQYEEDLQPLPAVVGELDDIVRDPRVEGAHGVLPGSILLDGQFTEKAMERQLDGAHPIVHIASHFVFRPGDDSNSWLLLAGRDTDTSGYHLTVADFRDNPNLRLDDTALLTLSACETGVGGNAGNGREVDGLAMTAQLKGAQAVLSSLWEVNDASTGKLMADFYKRWAGGGGKVTKVEALRQAQLDMLRGATGKAGAIGRGVHAVDDGTQAPVGFAHPYYWAPFVLVGNWK